MAYELAKNRINLLDIKCLGDDDYAVAFEYQYINKDRSRVWQKDIMIYQDIYLSDLYNMISDDLVEFVKGARAELEK